MREVEDDKRRSIRSDQKENRLLNIIDDVAYLYQYHIGEMAMDTIKATVDRLVAIKERLGGFTEER